LSSDDDGGEDISDMSLLQDSCARTAVYAPKLARCLFIQLILCHE